MQYAMSYVTHCKMKHRNSNGDSARAYAQYEDEVNKT